MPQIVKAFEQFLIETQTTYQREGDDLIFQLEFYGNSFIISVLQNGDDDLEVMVGWDVILPADDFETLETLLKQVARAGFIFGEVFGDDEHGYLVNRIHFRIDEHDLSPRAVWRMMSQLLNPFSEAIDRILQVMVGILTPEQALENFIQWSLRQALDQHKPGSNDRHLFD